MLQYRRRNSTSTYTQNSTYITTPLLTYCNWSYAPTHHIDLETLKNILRSFNQEYIPFYLRIFNKTPSLVVEAFLEQYHISKTSLRSISEALEADGFKVKRNSNYAKNI